MMQLSQCLRHCRRVARYPPVATSTPVILDTHLKIIDRINPDTASYFTSSRQSREDRYGSRQRTSPRAIGARSTGRVRINFNGLMNPRVQGDTTVKMAYLTVKKAVYSGMKNYDHDEFQHAANILTESMPHLSPEVVMKSLKLLLPAIAHDTPLITSLIRQLMVLLEDRPVLDIVELVPTLQPHLLQTEARQELNKNIISKITSSLEELKDPSIILDLMSHFLPRNQPEMIKLLTGHLNKMMDAMDGLQLLRFLSILAHQGVRWTSDLKHITSHLNQTFPQTAFTPPQLSQLLSALVTLNLPDKELIQQICDRLHVCLNDVNLMLNPGLINQFLAAFKMLRWRDTDLLDKLAQRLLSDISHLKLSHYDNLLNTSAILNHLPPAAECHLDAIIDRVDESMKDGEKEEHWLGAVWSLVVLQKASGDLISSVLAHSFIEKCEADISSVHSRDIWRLLTINAAAKCDLIDYSGPLLSPAFFGNKSGSPPESQMHQTVVKALGLIAPVEKFVQQHPTTTLGYQTDFEVMAKSDGQLFPLATAHTESNCHRVAIQLLNFKDMMLNKPQPSGPALVMKRHLESVGYTVVQIPYTEFGQKRFAAEQAVYIQEKIKAALASS